MSPTRDLQGIIPPMVTPLQGEDALDCAGLERLVEHILSGGVHGLFVLGTTGEAPGLSYRLRRELIRRSLRQVAGRVPVLVGVTDTSLTETVRLAEYAAEQGAAAAVLSAPYYFPAAGEELREYLGHLLPLLPLPVYLYNMPSHTKACFSPRLIESLLHLPNLAGVKDSSGNMVLFHEYREVLSRRSGLRLFMGPEELLGESVLLGGDGGVSGGANLFPSLYVAIFEAARAGDLERVRALHHEVMAIRRTLYSVGDYSSSFLKGLKCALSIRGICDDFMAEPFHRFRKEEREVVAHHLDTVLQRLEPLCASSAAAT